MRHQKAGFKLGRNHHERQSLFKNLISALIMHERLNTTTAKAKAIKPQVDKLMTKAKTGTLAARREVMSTLTDKTVVNKLFSDLAVRAKNRTSGFTRIQRVFRRLGDDTQMARIEFVDPKLEVKPEVKKEAKKAVKKTTIAKVAKKS